MRYSGCILKTKSAVGKGYPEGFIYIIVRDSDDEQSVSQEPAIALHTRVSVSSNQLCEATWSMV